MPIVVSLDLHANVTPEMVKYASVIDIFRIYPHIYTGETGAQVAGLIEEIITHYMRLFSSFGQPDFMIALNFGCSLVEPCKSLSAGLPAFIDAEVKSMSFACGFHLSDIYEVGPSVLAYGANRRSADRAVNISACEMLCQCVHPC